MKRAEDAQATQKISREQLDEALKRTKSGTRRAVRSDPALPAPEEVDRDVFFGPRDDAAPLLAHIDPSSLSPMVAAPEVVEPAEPVAPTRVARDTTLRLQPRTAFVVGLVLAALLVLAGLVGFFAGRSPQH